MLSACTTQLAHHRLLWACRWDEQRYGLEYDLGLFNVVSVSDFSVGAMENKSLNIFNSRLVLASPETATDADFARIQGVIGHEYFHNWTGNRVTCRDWFQLTLKEGLTVYRDSEFTSDMTSRAVKRIEDVMMMRTAQFAQDCGPMAHPIRPESYIKMDNFYTVTVYEKVCAWRPLRAMAVALSYVEDRDEPRSSTCCVWLPGPGSGEGCTGSSSASVHSQRLWMEADAGAPCIPTPLLRG